MATPTIDYGAIAKQYGGTSSGGSAPAPTVDYEALAKQFGGTSGSAAGAQVPAPQQPPSYGQQLQQFLTPSQSSVFDTPMERITQGVLSGVKAVSEGLGIPTVLDLLGGATRDPVRVQQSLQTFHNLFAPKALVAGAVGEINRIRDSLAGVDQAVRSGDVSGYFRNAAGVVPSVGGALTQAADEWDRGEHGAAIGHYSAAVVPFLVGAEGEGAAPGGGGGAGFEEGLETVRTAAQGAYRGVMDVLPKATESAAEKAGYGVFGGPHAVVGAAKVGFLKEAIPAAIKGAKQALEERSATAAAAAAQAEAASDAALRQRIQTFEDWERLTGRAPQAPPGLPAPPPPPIVTPPPADVSGVTAVPGQYPTVEPGFTRPAATPSTTTTPWTGPTGEPMTPGQVYAASQSVDWSTLRPIDRQQMENIARARANVASQPAPAAPPLTPQELTELQTGRSPSRQTEAAQQAAAETLATAQAAAPPAAPVAPEPAAAAPAVPPAAEAPAAPVASKPTAAEIARELENEMRPGLLTDYLKANRVPKSMVDTFGDKQWDLIAQGAGTQRPTAEQIAEIKQNLGEYEQAANLPSTAAQMTPAEAEAAVAPGLKAEPAALTAAQNRIEAFAQHFAKDTQMTPEEVRSIADNPNAARLLEELGRSLKIKGAPAPGEIAKIADRVGELRGQGTITPDVTQTQARGGPAVPGTSGAVQTPASAVARPAPGEGSVPTGTATTLRIPGESATYPARYTVRELADVQPSHNPHNFQPNERYTLRNDRNYSDAANQERIVLDSQPGRFIPEYLITDSPDAVNGPPVIDPTGNVLGGNSRAMKLARVYANSPQDAAAYRALLEQRAANYGIDPAQIRNMRQPILVRELTGSSESPQRLITDLNKSGTASLTAAERATADARRLSTNAADYLAQSIEAEGPNATLNDALSGKQGARIINQLVDDGVFTMQEKPALVDAKTGAVTAAAKERISKMLLGQVFEDADQLVRTPAELRNKLERIVAPLLQSGQKAGFDLIPKVRQALDLLEYARAHGIQNLADALGQESMFGDTPKFSAETAHLAEFLRDTKPTALAQSFRRYVANAEPSMFGESTPAQAFADAFGRPAPEPPASLGEMMSPKPPRRAGRKPE